MSVIGIRVSLSLLLLPLALTGCDPLPRASNVAARINGDQFEVAFCELAVGDQLAGDIEQASGDRWKTFWVATGDFRFDDGAIVRAGVDADGLHTTMLAPELINDDSLVIVHLYRDDVMVESAPFEFQADAPEGSWFVSDGTVRSSACGT